MVLYILVHQLYHEQKKVFEVTMSQLTMILNSKKKKKNYDIEEVFEGIMS